VKQVVVKDISRERKDITKEKEMQAMKEKELIRKEKGKLCSKKEQK